jgi:hypothetical protein
MTFVEIQQFMMSGHSPMPLALSTRGYTLEPCACSQQPLMPLGDYLFVENSLKVVLSPSLPLFKRSSSMGAEKRSPLC